MVAANDVVGDFAEALGEFFVNGDECLDAFEGVHDCAVIALEGVTNGDECEGCVLVDDGDGNPADFGEVARAARAD